MEGPAPAPAPAPDDPYFSPPGHGSKHRIFPGVEICTTAATQLMLAVVTFEPGGGVTEHSHPHEQMGLLISGRLEFTIGGVTRMLGPGDKWSIPGGVLHSVRAVDGPALAIDVFHPIREDYL